jgi:hypothetical protein
MTPRSVVPVTAPTCADCGATDWAVAVTEPDGSRLHVACWTKRKAEAVPGEGRLRDRAF